MYKQHQVEHLDILAVVSLHYAVVLLFCLFNLIWSVFLVQPVRFILLCGLFVTVCRYNLKLLC